MTIEHMLLITAFGVCLPILALAALAVWMAFH